MVEAEQAAQLLGVGLGPLQLVQQLQLPVDQGLEAPYNAKVSGQGRDVQVVGDQIDPGPYGIGIRKDDEELRSVLQDALREIIEDGSYDRVLTKWNVTDGALKSAKLAGA